MTIDEQMAYLTKGCVDVVRLDQLRAKVERSASTESPLVVKVGFDPTAPDLHLGHTVLIRKMKHFQDLGHTVVFLIGDFTGLIGDPTGRSKTRAPLGREDIETNAETYKAQIFKLLDSKKTIVDFNSRWLGPLGSDGWIRLAARYSVAQMLERRDFRQRYTSGQSIGIHEFFYPLAQAYDSVALKADVELGGTDQLWNMNVGRDIMPTFGIEPQVVMTMPLLVGLDGVEKMSKTAGNYVGITQSPPEMFGKLMSISDDLMWTYYELLTDLSTTEIDGLRSRAATGQVHPMQAKVDLAKRIIKDFWSSSDADEAADNFKRLFTDKELPADLREVQVGVDGQRLTHLLVSIEFAHSSSAAVRLIEQGGVRIDGEKVNDRWRQVPADTAPFILRTGKKVVKVTPARKSPDHPRKGTREEPNDGIRKSEA